MSRSLRRPIRSSIRTRLLAAFLAVAVISAASLSWYFLNELEAFALRRMEERLADEARVMASVLGSSYEQYGPAEGPAGYSEDAATELQLALQEVGPQVASRIRVLDVGGTAVADSAGDKGVGFEYGMLEEVQTALDGDYGAMTRILDDGRVALYIAIPITVKGEVVGVSYASSTTFSIMTLLRSTRTRALIATALFALVALAVTEILARWLSAPLRDLSSTATRFAAGDHSVRATPHGASETRAVAEAFNTMAGEVEQALAELKSEERRKTRFVSDVSHELRTPLTAIRGAAETLLDGDVPEEDERRFLATIARESERLARLANDLLTLQRIEGATGELPLRRIALDEVVRRAVESLEPLTDERGVAVAVTGVGADVLGAADRLQQVVANLLDNATRMTPAGGTVTVELAVIDNRVAVSVLDEGPGIAPDDLPNLFERFYRAQPSRDRTTGGAGLGLAIVKAIVVAHAGTIEASNRDEGGSRFEIRLPVLGD